MILFLQLLAGGLQLGALYALTAVGFSLIFGATRVFHVAHGSTFTLAGYVFLDGVNRGWGWPAAIAASIAAAVAFGVAMERLVYRPIQRSDGSFFTVFVASFGVVIVVQSFIELVFGRGFVSIGTSLTKAVEVVPGLYIAPVFWVSIGVAAILFAARGLLMGRTNVGIALRALAQNPDLLRAYGLSSSRLSMFVFALGSALVVPAAVLTAATSGLQPTVGAHLMLISLAATIVGGVGSLWGAAVAGIMLGIAENLAVGIINPQWSAAASFVVLFAFILFRPHGLFGKPVLR